MVIKRKLARWLPVLFAMFASGVAASEADHREFDATLHAPYLGEPAAGEARTFTLAFDYPLVAAAQAVSWRLELTAPGGRLVREWSGVETLLRAPLKVAVRWDGRAADAVPPAGIYQVRLQASAREAGGPTLAGEAVEQSWEIAVGRIPAPAMPAFRAMPRHGAVNSVAPAAGSLPYTVYLGNLHSQTGHSDGGGDLASCTGAQDPQSAALGPAEAYTYAMQRGLDILVASEHNHMYDGSAGTKLDADPTAASALYQSGLTAAAGFNAAHAGFLAVYGLEWGVIDNGGHMNIFNSAELLGWERNSAGQLLADTLTPKNDYAALYTLMRRRGWVGQFNHPARSGQFLINGAPMGYSEDGDQAMALCEVVNSNAFSINTSETETRRSNFEIACNRALEAGYHLAFSSNQDNHCANWGASYTNRTGVLLPNGRPLTNAGFIDALKARRVFATMDKGSQLVLTANGHIMGERFTNSGTLNLVANYASTGGKTVSTVVIYEGVPGRNGTVSQLSTTANTTITPALGEHFYYAKITQNDGNILWSAPIWVTQSDSGDITPPTVSATESGSSGTITLSASASDNVGVSLVEFYVDNVLKASSNVPPYSAAINSTTLSSGTHSLTAKAYDAAGNVGVSGAVSFSVNNVAADTTAPTVSASESGTSGTITLSATATDNVGVSSVEFYVDGALKGTDTTSPYSMTLNSTTLANGSHALTAKAFDAAGNNATSSAVNFSVSNAATQLLANSGFESGAASWTATAGVITNDASQPAHAGTYKAWLDGYGATHTDSLYQQVTIPAAATSATLAFWLKVVSDETTTTTAYDTLKVQMRSSTGTVLATLATYSNLNKGSTFLQKTFDLSAYKGQTVRIYFEGIEDSTVATSFVVDDVTLTAQ